MYDEDVNLSVRMNVFVRTYIGVVALSPYHVCMYKLMSIDV